MRLHSILAGSLLALGFGPAWAQVPLPADILVEAPAPNAPAGYAGAWGNGAWDSTLPGALVVERVGADHTADVIYAVGDAPRLRIAAQWLRLTGRIDDQWLILRLPNGAIARFRPGLSDQLVGDYTTADGHRSNIVLDRLRGSSQQIIASAALPVQPPWRTIEIIEHSAIDAAAGSDIRLEASLYRLPLPGRRPLVVFNHGSTDREPRGVPITWRYEAQARWFLTRGYNVVVPMRKGRGLSGGPMLEPSDHSVPDEVQVASAVEDLDTVIDAMRAEPWVDPALIVVAGVSRGGFLSVIYAARHPDKVRGVINFSGGWWSETSSGSGFNTTQLVAAGHAAHRPQLWLYADHDRYYSLDYTRRDFNGFVATGGTGDFAVYSTVRGDGHGLVGYLDLWSDAVAGYLSRMDETSPLPRQRPYPDTSPAVHVPARAR